MRKIREILRPGWGLGLTARQVAVSLGLARATVAEYVRPAEEAGLSWPLLPDCDDFVLERRPFSPTPLVATVDRPLFDWTEVALELRRKGVTLFLLSHEYKQAHPLGYQYSRYCNFFPGMGGPLLGLDAAGPQGGRADVRRLRRRHGRRRRLRDKRRAPGPGLRSRSPGFQLHLCRGDLDTGDGRLGWRPCPHFRVLRRCYGAGRLRQPEDRGQPGLPI